ncbi:MAG: hypothetical protein WCG27_08730 [Pseudomonadota bacterium]
MIDKVAPNIHQMNPGKGPKELGEQHSVDKYKYVPEKYKEVARNMEAQFAGLMLQEMEKSVGRENEDSSSDFYQSVMNSERSKTMSEHDRGLGVSKIILDQIYPERMRNPQSYEYFERMSKAANPAQQIAKYQAAEEARPIIKIYASPAKEASNE